MVVGNGKLVWCAEFFLNNMTKHGRTSLVDQSHTRVVQVRRRPCVEIVVFGRRGLQLRELLGNGVYVVSEDFEVEAPFSFESRKLVGQLVMKLHNCLRCGFMH